jgi:hypothetical protein
MRKVYLKFTIKFFFIYFFTTEGDICIGSVVFVAFVFVVFVAFLFAGAVAVNSLSINKNYYTKRERFKFTC